MTDMQEIGARLMTARENVLLDEKDVAADLNLPHTDIVQMETGKRDISHFELARFSELYLSPARWLLKGKEKSFFSVMQILHHHAEENDWPDSTRREVSKTLNLCHEAAALKRHLAHNLRNTPTAYKPTSISDDVVATGEKYADKERRRLGLGHAPIDDVVELVSDNGIWVSPLELPEDVSGAFVHEPSIGVAILVNDRHEYAKRRFSVACQYAHVVLDRDRMVYVSDDRNGDLMIERRAKRFAEAFLLPAMGVKEELRKLGKGRPIGKGHPMGKNRLTSVPASEDGVEAPPRSSAHARAVGFQDVIFIANRFGVSYQLTVDRLTNLGFINSQSQKRFLSNAAESAVERYFKLVYKFTRSEEETHVRSRAYELRAKLAELVIEAYRQEKISTGRLREYAQLMDFDDDGFLELAKATLPD